MVRRGGGERICLVPAGGGPLNHQHDRQTWPAALWHWRHPSQRSVPPAACPAVFFWSALCPVSLCSFLISYCSVVLSSIKLRWQLPLYCKPAHEALLNRNKELKVSACEYSTGEKNMEKTFCRHLLLFESSHSRARGNRTVPLQRFSI